MPLFWLSLSFLTGIVLADWLPWQAAAWLALAAAGLVCHLLLHRFSRLADFLKNLASRIGLPPIPGVFRLPLPLLVLVTAGCLGAVRYQSSLPEIDPQFIAYYNDQESRFVAEGLVSAPPDERDTYTNLRVSLQRLRPEASLQFLPVNGLLLVRVAPGGDWRYGDVIRLEGRLETPPQDEEFSYREYLARQGVYSLMEWPAAHRLGRDQGSPILAAIYGVKERALGITYRIFPDPEASLVAGILLGNDQGLSLPLQQAFRATGTAHIIAISGFNFSLIAGLFAALAGRLFGARRGAVVALAGITLYTLLVGAQANVVRAALVGGLSIIASQLGRRQNGLNSLLFVSALMAFFEPNLPWDVSFQLSFAAVLGLVLYADALTRAAEKLAGRFLPQAAAGRLARLAGEYLLFTLAATVTTLPVTIYHFRSLSLVSLLANPFILPAQPPLMVLGGLAILLGLLFPPLGQAAAYLAWPFVRYTIVGVELFARLSGGAIALGQMALPAVITFYLLLLLVTFAALHLKARLKTFVPTIGLGIPLAALGLVTVLTWQAALAAPDGRLHLVLLDTNTSSSSGEAVLIQTPGGRAVLVNGGPSASRLSEALGRRLPLLSRRLDYLVVAASGETHLAALPATLERFPAERVLWAGATHASAASRRLWEQFGESGIPVWRAETGQALDLGAGATLQVLAAGSRGAVLLLEWERFRAVLPIGADFETLEGLLGDPRLASASALLLAESGYAPLNSPEWVAWIRPQVILLSAAGTDNQGLPSPETLEAVEGYTLLRTDWNGWIEITTDGEKMWVEVERE